MAYNKNTWHRGDVVSSSGLNNMEDGIAANDAAISEIHDPAKSAIAEGGIGYYDKTTLLNETIPVADWVDEAQDAYAEIDVTGIELSADKKYWIVIDGVATKCDYGEVDDDWFIVPIDPETPFPAIGTNISGNYSLFLAELPTEPVSFQLIEGEAQKISNDFLQPSGGGYDAEIDVAIEKSNEDPEPVWTSSVINGDFNAIKNKILAGIPVNICTKCTSSPEEGVTITTAMNPVSATYLENAEFSWVDFVYTLLQDDSELVSLLIRIWGDLSSVAYVQKFTMVG